MNYEKKIERLNEISKQLDDQNLSIEATINLYNEAKTLFDECFSYLKEAKGNVLKIKQDLEKYSEEDF